MRSLYVMVIALVAATAGCSGDEDEKMGKSLGPGQHDQSFEGTISNKVKLNYLVYLPKGYGETGEKRPLILFLHGAGERGDNLRQVELHGPPKVVKEKDLPFIIVSPQCGKDTWWPKEIDALAALLEDVVKRFDADPDRIYLTGLSMGGFGTWALACDRPELFAAIAPICGGGEPLLGGQLRNVPVWAFHGAKDNIVPAERSEVMVQSVRKVGGEARLTVYPEAGHDSWAATYRDGKVLEWLFGRRRGVKE